MEAERVSALGNCQLWETVSFGKLSALGTCRDLPALGPAENCQLWETAVAKDPRNETKCTCLELAQRQLERPREKVSAEGRELAGEKSKPEVAT